MMNPTQKKKIITAAILETITAGNGEWITGILPAVKATNVTKTMNGWTIRNCLQGLIDAGLVYRVHFINEERYDLTVNKLVPLMPEAGWTVEDALYKGDLVHEIANASMLNYEDGASIETATCSLTGIVVRLGHDDQKKETFTIEGGADITALYWKALGAAVGA